MLEAVLGGAAGDEALRLLDRCSEAGSILHAPDLLVAECAHVLLKRRRSGYISSEQAVRAYESVRTLALYLHPFAPLSPATFRYVLTQSLDGNDAIYLALARDLGLPLVTLDGKLRDRAGDYAEAINLRVALARLQN